MSSPHSFTTTMGTFNFRVIQPSNFHPSHDTISINVASNNPNYVSAMTIELQRLAEQRLTPSMSVYDISNNVFLDVELLEPSLSYKLWQGMTLDYAETQILKAWNVSPRQREAFTKMTLKQVERFFL